MDTSPLQGWTTSNYKTFKPDDQDSDSDSEDESEEDEDD